jgi:hypothetical protein
MSCEFRINFNKGNLRYAMATVAAVLIPPELEKISIHRPNRKETSRKFARSFLKGYKKTNNKYKFGFIYPNRYILFKISV